MRPMDDFSVKPAELLISHVNLFIEGTINGPILDLACGDGHNGIFLAKKSLEVICCDVSEEALKSAKKLAAVQGVGIETWRVDLEKTEPILSRRFLRRNCDFSIPPSAAHKLYKKGFEKGRGSYL